MQLINDQLARRRSRGSAGAVALLLLGGVMLAACGSSASTSSAGTSSAGTSSAGTSSTAAGATVKITLTEWALIPDVSSASAGAITFDVTNAGTMFTHEFVVIKTDLAAADLPVDAAGKVNETAAGVANVGEIGEVLIGANKTVSLTLQPGKYVLICNIVEAAGGHESHYTKGMRAAFTVN